MNKIFDRSVQVDFTTVHFQCISWNDGDFQKLDNNDIEQYEIYISGVNNLSQSVSVRVIGFTPYFFVLVPDIWNKLNVDLFFKYLKERLHEDGQALVGCELVKRKKLYPYLAGRKFKFVKLLFSSAKAFKRCTYIFTRKNQEKPLNISGIDKVDYFEAFETNIKHLNRFCHVLGLETTGWIRVNKYEEDTEYTCAQINIIANWRDISPDLETKSIAPVIIFSWDIECRPENTEEFPNPEIPGDVIKQISVVLNIYGSETFQSFIFTSAACSPIKHCIKCRSSPKSYTQFSCVCGSTQFVSAVVVESIGEIELLRKFINFIKTVDPDIITGYNIWGFDDIYLWKRCVMHKVSLSGLSRINLLEPNITKKELTSSAYGNNEFNYIWYPGRETFDMLVALRREHKLDSMSLNSVSKHFLNENKIDLPYRLLFEKLNGNPDDIAECASYCIKDSYLTIKLFLKLAMLPNYVEMARATYVPMEWLLFRGQQCKIFSLIIKESMETGYIIPVYEKKEIDNKFQGATVVTPKIGLHYDAVAGLDFASLYPSIMMAYNMCYSTFIESKEMMKYVVDNNIPYKKIEWDDNSFSFVQIEDQKGVEIPNGVRGILGIILMRLMQGRKATKRLMSVENDPFMKAVYNGKQLAQKVSMNSAYGFTGSNNGILPLKAIASSVTAIGRQMIEATGKMASSKYGAIILYGDSIPPNELITIDGIGDIEIEKFGELIPIDWEEYRGFMIDDTLVKNKEYKNLIQGNYLALTHEGPQKIKKIIRHRTPKKIYKITARDSKGNIHSVRVTEGHSLILESGELITPTNLKIGSKLWSVS